MHATGQKGLHTQHSNEQMEVYAVLSEYCISPAARLLMPMQPTHPPSGTATPPQKCPMPAVLLRVLHRLLLFRYNSMDARCRMLTAFTLVHGFCSQLC